MSPRAAWRLENYGYGRVYDYVPGKSDWLAFNLAREGWAKLAGDVLTHEVPTCSARDKLGDIRSKLEDSRAGLAVALNHGGVIMGTVTPKALEGDQDADVGEVMREGPTTVRPSEEIEGLVERMRNARVDGVLVTSSDGKLLGLFERSVGEERLAQEQQSDHQHH